jgi:multiple sugar transport system permease protein
MAIGQAATSADTVYRRRPRTGLATRQAAVALIFLTPALIYFSLFFFYPIGKEFWLSLHSGQRANVWVGMDNYVKALHDSRVWHSFWVTGVFAVGTTVGSIVIGLGLALLLDKPLRGRVLFRAILLFPYMISIVIIALMWRNILDPYVGILNRILAEVGLPQQFWLTNNSALFAIIGITVWQYMGYNMVLFLAGLQGIPQDYYDAAKVDGAGSWSLFRNITLPLLAPTTLFVSVIGVITSLQAFAQPYIITQGGPADATRLYVYHVFEAGFSQLDFGYASALAFLMFVVVLVLTAIQLWIGRRGIEY